MRSCLLCVDMMTMAIHVVSPTALHKKNMGSILTEQLNLNGQIYSSYVGKENLLRQVQNGFSLVVQKFAPHLFRSSSKSATDLSSPLHCC